jgi:hypothetical protein
LQSNKILSDVEDECDSNIKAGIATGMPKIFVSQSEAIGDPRLDASSKAA